MISNVIIIVLLLNILCILCIYLFKGNHNKGLLKQKFKYLCGAPIGITFSLMFFPISIENILLFALVGNLLSETFALFFMILRSTYQTEIIKTYYDDGTPRKFYITGDKHRNFKEVKSFCRDMKTRNKDVLIILGDSGFNYFDDEKDDKLKAEISALNITLFCLHGNKENRPENVGTYGVQTFCGGKVYYEPRYPKILFAIDGEIYTFEGKKYMVVGGAHSVDKTVCIEENKPFWEDEMPSDEIKAKVEERLAEENNIIYGMLTHTCPMKYLPTEMFMSTRQNAVIKRKPRKAKSKKIFTPDIDRTTEQWLDDLENKLNYDIWFCGHYHIDKTYEKVIMLHNEIRPLHQHLYEE